MEAKTLHPGTVPGRAAVAVATGSPAVIAAICIMGFVACLALYYPGWMSFDSRMQFEDARNGTFRNWHPVLMAWWWGKLNLLSEGPQLMLVENLALYWTGWGLFAAALRHRYGRLAYLVPLGGVWPGLLLTLGWIWKDVFFAGLMFCAFSIIAAAAYGGKPLRWPSRIALFALAVFALGVKTNGLTVLPFLLGYWAYVEGWWRRPVASALAVAALLAAVVGASFLIVPADRIIDQHPTQYMLGHDLLGIGMQTGEMLLPEYLTDGLSTDPKQINELYSATSFLKVFITPERTYKLASDAQFADLSRRWVDAITQHPVEYLKHRLRVFMALLRIGQREVWAGNPPTMWHPAALEVWRVIGNLKFAFFPWGYALVFVGCVILLPIVRVHRPLLIALGGGAVAFVAPHVLVAPSWDFRYLYFAYLVTVLFAIMVVLECVRSQRKEAAAPP